MVLKRTFQNNTDNRILNWDEWFIIRLKKLIFSFTAIYSKEWLNFENLHLWKKLFSFLSKYFGFVPFETKSFRCTLIPIPGFVCFAEIWFICKQLRLSLNPYFTFAVLKLVFCLTFSKISKSYRYIPIFEKTMALKISGQKV
jgi:hypothetical protein